MSRLLIALLCLGASVAMAQVNVPNPMIRPMSQGPAGATPDGLPRPPAPQVRPAPTGLPDLQAAPGAADPQGANAPSLRSITAGMYVATIMNRRAILRTSMSTAGMPGQVGAGAALPSMQPQGLPGQAGVPGAPNAAMPTPRLMSFTVRDGERFFLTDTVEVTARVADKTVELFQDRNGKRSLVFRGEVDSIASQTAPRPNQNDLQKRNQDYLNSISVSELSFKSAPPTAGGTGTTPTNGTTGSR